MLSVMWRQVVCQDGQDRFCTRHEDHSMRNWNRPFTREVWLGIHYFLKLIICIQIFRMLLLLWPELYTDVLGEDLSFRGNRESYCYLPNRGLVNECEMFNYPPLTDTCLFAVELANIFCFTQSGLYVTHYLASHCRENSLVSSSHSWKSPANPSTSARNSCSPFASGLGCRARRDMRSSTSAMPSMCS